MATTTRDFFTLANEFIDGALLSHLQAVAKYYNGQGNLGLIIRILPSTKTDVVCEVSDMGLRVVEISYSTIFAHKMLCLLKLFEANSTTYHSRTRVFAFDSDHPFDSHVWDYPRDESYAFCANPVLEPYLSRRRGLTSVEAYEAFLEDVNNAKDGAFAIVGFTMDGILSEEVKQAVLDFFAFMVLHELAHMARKHDVRLQLWPYQSLSRRTSLAGRIYRYRHKAVECDADLAAFAALAQYELGRKPHFLVVQKLLQTIAIGFCLFDSDRRNTFDQKSVDGLYPAPEIRFEILCHMLEQSGGITLATLRNDIIAYCIRSFQGLGLVGSFYMFSGPLSTLDDQFFKEVNMLGSVETEIGKILQQSNVILASCGVAKVGIERKLLPIGMTEAQFADRLKRDTVAMFTQGSSFADREEHARSMSARLVALREDGTIRSGDHVLVLADQLSDLRPEIMQMTRIEG